MCRVVEKGAKDPRGGSDPFDRWIRPSPNSSPLPTLKLVFGSATFDLILFLGDRTFSVANLAILFFFLFYSLVFFPSHSLRQFTLSFFFLSFFHSLIRYCKNLAS